MSTLKVNALQDTSGNGWYPAKAWVNFNGSGTVAIRDDGSVSSITDRNTGKYGVNYTNSFPNVNYAAVSMIRADTDYAPTSGQPHEYATQSTSQTNLKTGAYNVALDSSVVTLTATYS